MPEIPDLEAIVSYLRSQIVGATIVEVKMPLPWLVRADPAGEPERTLKGEQFEGITRRGKFVVFSLKRSSLVVHPMLVGRFYYVPSKDRFLSMTVLALTLSTGKELRYVDSKKMGRVYIVPGQDFSAIPGFMSQGPDPLDKGFTFEQFLDALRGRYGEIKGLLTNATVLSGIGNAYADEILFEAGVYPFKKKKELSQEELQRIYAAIPKVLHWAKNSVAQQMGTQIHMKIRDFLRVHGKGGKLCPSCGQRIATVGHRERSTQFCRRCQPGIMTDPFSKQL